MQRAKLIAFWSHANGSRKIGNERRIECKNAHSENQKERLHCYARDVHCIHCSLAFTCMTMVKHTFIFEFII